MISIHVQNNIISLEDIVQDQLGSMLHWYNRDDEYRFATGMDSPISIETLEDKLRKSLCSESDFFIGIHRLFDAGIIGIMNGRLIDKILWINILAIDHRVQGKGYGSIAVELLLKHFKQEFNVTIVYLAVADENIKGYSFWLRNSFKDLKRVVDKELFDGKAHTVIIMERNL